MLRRRYFRSQPRAEAGEIELTESALMIDPERSASALKLLRSMGISIAIDDFGTGYSSLSYLRRLPEDAALTSTGLRAALTRASRLFGP